MLTTTEGIITRSMKYGETSAIFDLLTPDGGIQSFIIGGVRKKGRKNKSALVQVLNIVKVEAYIKDAEKLSRVKEMSYAYVYESIPFDVVKASVATFLIEICRKVISVSDDAAGVYNYVVKGFIHLDTTRENIKHFHLGFLIGLSQFLGFQIEDNYDEAHTYFDLRDGSFKPLIGDHRLCLDAVQSTYLHEVISGEISETYSKEQRKALLLSLVDYYRYHVDSFGELKTLAVLTSLYD